MGILVDARLPGQYFDPETGMNHNGFRDYAGVLTRYVESDPIGPRGGMNTYQYVRANPFKYTDTWGLDPGKSWQDSFLNNPLLKFVGNHPDWGWYAIKGGSGLVTFGGVGVGINVAVEGIADLGLFGDAAAEVTGYGDLSGSEINQIQNVVDQAGRPLDVVGSAASGERGPFSDIDYTAPSSSHPYFSPYEVVHQFES